jgi:excisionase family DNA binding protein
MTTSPPTSKNPGMGRGPHDIGTSDRVLTADERTLPGLPPAVETALAQAEQALDDLRRAVGGSGGPPPAARSVDEAARLIGVSRRQLYVLMHRGDVAFAKVGRRRVISTAEIERVVTRGTGS